MGHVINFFVVNKIKKVITNPLVIIFFFCFIIISGEEMGGFYMFYIFLGLPHFVLHSLFGLTGVVCLLFTFYSRATRIFLNLIGAFCMVISLISFFLQPNGKYNYQTFYSGLPLTTIAVFACVIILFIYFNVTALLGKNKKSKT